MERVSENTVFAGIRVPGTTGCHITITKANHVDHETTESMRQIWLHIWQTFDVVVKVEIGNFTYVGSNANLPAYKCRIVPADAEAALKAYHRMFYAPVLKDDKQLFPDLELHITVDTPARVKEIKDMIVGANKGVFDVGDLIFEAYDRNRDERDSVYDATTWTCCRCSNRNALGTINCIGLVGGQPCTQWRPKKAKRAHDLGPSAPPLTADEEFRLVQMAAPPPITSKPGFVNRDYWCPTCKYMCFGSKPKCTKCGFPRPEKEMNKK